MLRRIASRRENPLTAEKIELGRRLVVRFSYARADLAFTL